MVKWENVFKVRHPHSAGIDAGTNEMRVTSAIVERPLAPQLEGARSAVGESWRPVRRRPEQWENP